jgi:hypothetical protein
MGGTGDSTGYMAAQMADQRRRALIEESTGARAVRTARRASHTRRGPIAAFNAWLAAGQL